MKTLFIFPGQGAQYAGIGKDLFQHHDVFKQTYEQACDVLNYDIKKLSFEDPESNIHFTRYTQPVLLTHEIACLRTFAQLTNNAITPDMCAGHSLGEYSALTAAGVLSFEDALRAVKKRGELMSDYGQGEMSAFACDIETIADYCDDFYCAIAGCNLPDQTVIGGSSQDLAALEDKFAEDFPKKRFTRLKTEGAFHTYYMVQAAIEFRKYLAGVNFAASDTRVLSNFTGGFHHQSANSIRSRLFYQLFHPVMWHKNLMTAHQEGIKTVIEFGGGIGQGETAEEKRANLEGMIKKAYRREEVKPDYYAVINQGTLESTIEALTQ